MATYQHGGDGVGHLFPDVVGNEGVPALLDRLEGPAKKGGGGGMLKSWSDRANVNRWPL